MEPAFTRCAPSPLFVSGSFFAGIVLEAQAPVSGVVAIDESRVYRWDSCLAAQNSPGFRGLLAASENLDAAVAAYGVHLSATCLPDGNAGSFLASQTQVPRFNVRNSNRRLCIGGTILRIEPSLFTVNGERSPGTSN